MRALAFVLAIAILSIAGNAVAAPPVPTANTTATAKPTNPPSIAHAIGTDTTSCAPIAGCTCAEVGLMFDAMANNIQRMFDNLSAEIDAELAKPSTTKSTHNMLVQEKQELDQQKQKVLTEVQKDKLATVAECAKAADAQARQRFCDSAKSKIVIINNTTADMLNAVSDGITKGSDFVKQGLADGAPSNAILIVDDADALLSVAGTRAERAARFVAAVRRRPRAAILRVKSPLSAEQKALASKLGWPLATSPAQARELVCK